MIYEKQCFEKFSFNHVDAKTCRAADINSIDDGYVSKT